MRALTLMYHDVVGPEGWAGSGFPGADADTYKLTADEFRAHLEVIARGRPRVVVADELGRGDGRPLLFTFDDGGISALRAADLLEERGWRGHFFVASDFLGTPTFLSAAQARELVGRGHVIGSHSARHPLRMGALPYTKVLAEWTDSVARLQDALGSPITTASVSGGYYTRAVGRAAAQAGLRVLFNSEPTSRLHRVSGCLIVGRYTIQRPIAAETAAALARGGIVPRWRQSLWWNAKKVPKRLGGELFLAVRKKILK